MEATDGFYHLRDRCRDHRPGEWYHAVRLARIEQIEMGCDDQQSGQREVFQACGRGWRRRLSARPSFAVEGPRASALASRARASPSARSKGAGMRNLMSRPLALTLLSSNV